MYCETNAQITFNNNNDNNTPQQRKDVISENDMPTILFLSSAPFGMKKPTRWDNTALFFYVNSTHTM